MKILYGLFICSVFLFSCEKKPVQATKGIETQEIIESEGILISQELDESYFPWRNILRIYSSSELAERYGAENMLDRTWRSWSEGAEGNGIGEYFTVEFKLPVKLSGFWLRNGFGLSSHFYKNNRVKTFEILFDDDTSGELVNIIDEIEDRSYYFERTYVNGTFIECTKITFIIRDIYHGTEYDDTCIAEIFFSPPLVMGPPGRWGERYTLNSYFNFLQTFTTDSYTIGLIKAMYEGYGVRTRLDSDNQLQIYEYPSFDTDKMWFMPDLNLSGEVNHKYFAGTGAGKSGHRYKIFLSPDFPPILIVFSWDTTSMMYWESELLKIQLFNGTSWEDHKNESGIMPLLRLKEEIEARGLLCQFSFGEDDVNNQNSLILFAVEMVKNDKGDTIRNVLETYNFLWNGNEFEKQ
jgi:hypothetical protein